MYTFIGDTIMISCDLFKGLTEDEFEKIEKCFNMKRIAFKKDQTILSNAKNSGTVGVVVSGDIQLVRIDYMGNRTILAEYQEGDVFGDVFSNISSIESSVISKTNSEIIFIDYDHIINRCKKNCSYHNTVVENMVQILAKRISIQNERIEVLTKRSIRDKLLGYFNNLSKKARSKIIYLPFTYTDLADYLSIDRASMMREIKNLKDDNLIKTQNKMIKLLY